MRRECRTAKEFGDIFRSRVAEKTGHSWNWKRDMAPWLGAVFHGARFGDPAFDWTPEAARHLADEFLSEASTW